jgi:cell division protein FtsB
MSMRIIALSLLAIVALLQYRLWVSDSGMREVWRLRREVASQQDVNEQLKDRNRTLTAEVLDLKKGKSAIEERARTDLGMVGSNETFFQVAPGKVTAAKADAMVAQQSAAATPTTSGTTNNYDTQPAATDSQRRMVGTHATAP